ncbi:hypothetical protein G9A89_012360 [Geosiphon pyriformis]|nr:hypothetical protein G9A89_012360 [Geosiphon pyriformis]
MSNPSAKKKSARVSTVGSVGSDLIQKVKKPLSGVKLSSTDKNLKDGGPVSVDRQPTSMNTDGEAFDGKVTSDFQMNMPNAKHFNTGVAIGSPLGSINYDMDDEEEVEIAVKKSFALDINLSAVEGKLAMAKTQVVRKLFSRINGFGGATTPSKFEGIIRSTFTSSESMEKATSLARKNDIMVNSNLKRQGVHSDRAVVIKEILMDTPKKMIIATVSEFGQVAVVEFAESSQADQLAAKWSFLIEKNSVRVAKAVQDRETWASRDWYKVLLFTLPMGTTAHDLGNLLAGAGGKTCVINYSLDTGNKIRCAVICFENNKNLESAFCTEPVFGGVKLSWARLDLVWCERCGKLGHSVLECDAEVSHSPKLFKSFKKKVVSDENRLQLAKLYAKKSVPISRLAAFGSKSWVQVVYLASSFNSSHFGSGPDFGSSLGASGLVGNSSLADPVSSILETHLTSLECSLELLMNKMSSIVGKLDSLSLVPLALTSSSQPLVAPGSVDTKFGSDMVLDEPDSVVDPPSLISSGASRLGSSSSKILTSKVGCLESKMVALEVLVSSVLEKLDQMCAGSDSVSWITTKFDGVRVFTSGLDFGYLGSGVAIVMNNSLARHVFKVSEVPGRLLSIRLLFKNKLSVSVLGLYTGASSGVRFLQAGDINSLIAKVINESSFVVLGGDFNEDGVHKSASFKKCIDLGLVNVLAGSVLAKTLTWGNSRGVVKTIDYMFVSSSLINTVVDHDVTGVENFFNTDHKAVSVSVGLIMVLSAVGTFKKKWFKGYDEVFTKSSSKFHKLELLVFKLVKASRLLSNVEFASLLNTWEKLDVNDASKMKSLFLSSSSFDRIRSALAKARKSYRFAKLLESKHAEESHIRAAIDRRMESFELDKGHTIRSVLEHPFRKVVLDHLVVGDELILEPSLVKARMDGIMKGWNRKHKVAPDISDIWSCQYMSLEHVFNSAFSGVMNPVGFNELFSVVSGLPKGKAAGLFEILNELWKHCDRSILDMLLGTATQFPIFAIGSVIEDALEKNRELWLVLQDMWKAYDSVGWEHFRDSLVRIKMCCRFIRFFGGIHNGYVNRVMTDFGLMDRYEVHDGLDQGEVFLPLLWRIFYDPLLYEVDSSQSATQHILNIASEFFSINDISINNNKTVAIPINCDGMASFLLISRSPISIAKKGESHHYLGIYLSTEGLSKPSLAKVHSDVWFFSNLVLRKAVSDKQFSYLVSAVLFFIIEYRTQFSYVPISACGKWDTLIRKGLRSKSGLPCDFPNDVIHHPSLYGLKTFEQVQAESKMALVVSFANSVEILGHLFSYQLHDLQVLWWHPLHLLQCPVRVKVNSLNNFLAGVVHIFSGCDLLLGGFLPSAFRHWGETPMSLVLDRNGAVFKWKTFKRWKRLDLHGLIPVWFELLVHFLGGVSSLPVCSTLSADCGSSDVLQSHEFGIIGAGLFNSNVGRLSVYTDGSLSDLGTVDMKARAAVFFEDIGMGLGVGVSGLMSSTLAELQTIALAFKCVPFSRSVDLFSDSQAALNACKLEIELVRPDFRNQCWIECRHIVNVIHHKNLKVNWCKVKEHSGVLGNERADKLARAAALSGWHLPHSVNERYLRGGGAAISGNSRHFVRDIFWLLLVWHPDSHMAADFTNKQTAGFQTYFMKALHHRLSVAVLIPSVTCLFCGDVEVSDHVFSCSFDANGRAQLLDTYAAVWGLMSTCVSDISVSIALCKGFVFKDWFHESVSVFKDSRIVGQTIMAFVHEFSLAFWEDIWLVCAKHRAFMEKNGLIPCNGSVPVLISGLSLGLSSGVTQLLGVAEAIGVSFGFHKFCLFFFGIGGKVSVHIGA